MAKTAPLEVNLLNLEAVKALEAERDALRDLVQSFEQRVVCPQCGNRYTTSLACGPSHALVARLVLGPQEGT